MQSLYNFYELWLSQGRNSGFKFDMQIKYFNYYVTLLEWLFKCFHLLENVTECKITVHYYSIFYFSEARCKTVGIGVVCSVWRCQLSGSEWDRRTSPSRPARPSSGPPWRSLCFSPRSPPELEAVWSLRTSGRDWGPQGRHRWGSWPGDRESHTGTQAQPARAPACPAGCSSTPPPSLSPPPRLSYTGSRSESDKVLALNEVCTLQSSHI